MKNFLILFLTVSTLLLCGEKRRTLVVIAPHPDDAEASCGGLIANAVAAGDSVIILTMTAGEIGIWGKTQAEARAIRTTEAKNAAAVLGASVQFFGGIDGSLAVDTFTTRRLTDILLKINPDVVTAPWPLDVHSDHQASGMLAWRVYLDRRFTFDLYFYETSSDNGATWQLRYSGVGYGDPAIAAVNSNRVVIVYPTGNITAVCYDLATNSVISTSSVLLGNGADEPNDVNIAITSNGKILVTWYNNLYDPEGYYQQGYYARYGSINSSGVMSWLSYYDYEHCQLTSSTASHAAIDVRIHDGDGLFHFAFEDYDDYGNRQIYYCPLIYSGGVVQWYVYSPYNNCLSSSSGFENNTNPSFIAVNSSEATRFNWLGELEGAVMSVFKDPGYYRYWNFGYGVTSTSINKVSDGYVIGWSNGYDQSYTNSSTLYELGSISSTGRYVQVATATISLI
jgi:hypothetical protein